MRWPLFTSRTPAGIDIGARTIKAAQLRRSAGGWRLVAVASLPRANPGTAPEAEEIRRLCDALSRQGFLRRDAVVAVPQDKLLHGRLELPPAGSGAPLAQIARTEFARMHGCQPHCLEMISWPLPESPATKGQSEVLAAGCTHETAESFLDVLEAGGLNVLALDTHARALARACRPALEGSAGIVGIVDVGWTACQLLVLHRGVIVYDRSLPEAGVERLCQTLAEQLDLKGEQIEILLGKSGMGEDDANADQLDLFQSVRRIIAGHFHRNLQEVQAPFSYARQRYPDSSMDRVLLVGGGALIPGVEGELASALDVTNTRVLAPTDLAECPPSLLGDWSKEPVAAAIGLAQFRR